MFLSLLACVLLGTSACVTSGGGNHPPPPTFSLPEADKVEVRELSSRTSRAGGLAFSKEGVLYFANHLTAGTIGRHAVADEEADAETFIDLSEWMSARGERKPRAHGIRLDPEGRLLAAEAGTGKVIRISQDAGKLEVLADAYDGTLLGNVWDVAVAPDGDVFASSPNSGLIYRIRPGDGFVGAVNDDLVRACGLAVSPDGTRLVAAEPDAARVVVFDLRENDAPGKSWTLVDFSATGEEPSGLAFDEAGRLYVAMGETGKVRVFDLEEGHLLRTYDAGGEAEFLAYRDGALYVSGGDSFRGMHLRPEGRFRKLGRLLKRALGEDRN